MTEPDRLGQEGIGTELLRFCLLVYGGMLLAAVLWLWLRGRLETTLPVYPGHHGIVVSIVAGLGIGLALSGVLSLLVARVRIFSQLQDAIAALVCPLSRGEIHLLAITSGIAEEVFFRLAFQDAAGVLFSVTVFALLHTGPGPLLAWTPFAFAVGLLFAMMVERGFGLLSVIVAHAVVNQLSLRRMMHRWS